LKEKEETASITGNPFEKNNLGPCITEYVLKEDVLNKIMQDLINIPSNLWGKGKIGAAHFDKPISRQCEIFFLSDQSKNDKKFQLLDNYIFNVFEKAIQSYQKDNAVFICADEGYQVVKYNEGGFYKAHVDGGEDFLYRKVSGIIYLNDDYEGGELEFTKFNLKIKPKKNSIVLFPSNYAYEHRAHPVIKGQKMCIVTWFFSTGK
jgi:hypothetical protein